MQHGKGRKLTVTRHDYRTFAIPDDVNDGWPEIYVFLEKDIHFLKEDERLGNTRSMVFIKPQRILGGSALGQVEKLSSVGTHPPSPAQQGCAVMG